LKQKPHEDAAFVCPRLLSSTLIITPQQPRKKTAGATMDLYPKLATRGQSIYPLRMQVVLVMIQTGVPIVGASFSLRALLASGTGISAALILESVVGPRPEYAALSAVHFQLVLNVKNYPAQKAKANLCSLNAKRVWYENSYDTNAFFRQSFD
jgi:hypothetical protein